MGIALATSAFIATASAQPQQTYPNRPIRLIVPFGAGAGTDIGALAAGYVSVTPLQLDLTAHDLMPDLEGWKLQLD